MGNYKFKSEEAPEVEVQEKPKVRTYTKTTICRLNNREQPDGKILKVFDLGTKVKVVTEKNGWSQLEDGTYVMSKFLK